MAQQVPSFDLSYQGIDTSATLHWNLGPALLVEEALKRGEGLLAQDGPLVVRTGKHTGRSAQDKFIVRDAETENNIWWDNNASIAPEHFAALREDFLSALGERTELFVQDLYGGSQSEHRVRVRVINELAWHSLFIRTLLVRPGPEELPVRARFTIIDLPSFRADPPATAPVRRRDRGEFDRKLILIGGTLMPAR